MRGVAEEIAAQLRRPFPIGRVTRDAAVARMVAAGPSYDFAHLQSDA
jgi:hypothetical protein